MGTYSYVDGTIKLRSTSDDAIEQLQQIAGDIANIEDLFEDCHIEPGVVEIGTNMHNLGSDDLIKFFAAANDLIESATLFIDPDCEIPWKLEVQDGKLNTSDGHVEYTPNNENIDLATYLAEPGRS